MDFFSFLLSWIILKKLYLCPHLTHIIIRMKKIVFVLALFLLITPLSAQVTFGVKAGAGFSSLVQRRDGQLKSGGRFGYSVAGIADIRLYHRVSLRPELAFTSQGGSFYSHMEGDFPEDHNSHYYSIQIPVNVMYTFTYEDVKFGVGGGPALDIPLWGYAKVDGHHHGMSFGTKTTDNLKAIDLGVNVGINIEYHKFFFSVNSFSGVLNMSPLKKLGEPSLYQNNVTFSVGYMFRR